MNLLSHPEIIGIDVSRDWLDIHCLADGRQLRLPNTDDGHSQPAEIAGDRNTWFASRPRATKSGGSGRAWRVRRHGHSWPRAAP